MLVTRSPVLVFVHLSWLHKGTDFVLEAQGQLWKRFRRTGDVKEGLGELILVQSMWEWRAGYLQQMRGWYAAVGVEGPSAFAWPASEQCRLLGHGPSRVPCLLVPLKPGVDRSRPLEPMGLPSSFPAQKPSSV